MKRKIVMITAMLAVMAAMTGVAAAITLCSDPEDPTCIITAPDYLPAPPLPGISPGETKSQAVTLSVPSGNTIYSLTVIGLYDPNNGWAPFDVSQYFTVHINDGMGHETECILGSPCTLGGTWTSPQTWTVSYTNNNAPNGVYYVKYIATHSAGPPIMLDAQITAKITTIPEFPTVALPVAAVIGLVYVFNSRKKEEE